MIILDEQLKGINSVGICGHVRPDGDCVGSCLAVYNYIKDNYPNIRTNVFLQKVPDEYSFLARFDEIVEIKGYEEEKNEEKFRKIIEKNEPDNLEFDLFVVLDCGDIGRIGPNATVFKMAKKTIVIDHHATHDSFADESYVVSDASSTCELVFKSIFSGVDPKFDSEKISKSVAECIYTGIVSDTGVFQYSCTKSSTMEIAGILMDMGIDYSKIIDRAFYAKTFLQTKIMGYALYKAVMPNDKCVYTYLTLKEMSEHNVTSRDFEGIVSQLRYVDGVEVAIFLYENPDGSWKGSLRSTNDVDVARIASNHNGGGHIKAAGFTEKGDPIDIVNDIVDEIMEQL